MSATGEGIQRRTRIIGIGSPVAGDDLGWHLARALQAAGPGLRLAEKGVDVVLCEDPCQLLLGVLDGLGLAVLIDAMCMGLPPGTLRRLDRRDLRESQAWTSHGFGVARVLALGHALGLLPPRVIVYGIETGRPCEMPAFGDWVAHCERVVCEDIRQVLAEPVADAAFMSGCVARKGGGDAVLP